MMKIKHVTTKFNFEITFGIPSVPHSKHKSRDLLDKPKWDVRSIFHTTKRFLSILSYTFAFFKLLSPPIFITISLFHEIYITILFWGAHFFPKKSSNTSFLISLHISNPCQGHASCGIHFFLTPSITNKFVFHYSTMQDI